MKSQFSSERLLSLLSYSRSDSISRDRLEKLFGEQSESISELLISCGCSALKLNGGHHFLVTPESRVRLGIALCELRVDVEKVAKSLTWRDFEIFVAKVAEANGYRVRHDVRLKKPRLQADVVCSTGRFGIAFDCKHWRKTSTAGLSAAAVAQRERTKKLLKHGEFPDVSVLLPAIVTVYDTSVRMVDGVAVVPINVLNDFLLNAEYYIQAFSG